jgi:hypothetical protein
MISIIQTAIPQFGSFLVHVFYYLKHVLYNWQSFFGSLIGALVAILIFTLTERNKSKKEYKNHLHLLHRSIGAILQNLSETDVTVNNFAENQLNEMMGNVDADIKNGHPTVCYGFVPLLHIFEVSEELLRRSSGSGYVDIQTIQLINKSKDFRKIIDDINRQFESTILMNNKIVLSGVNKNPLAQSATFKKNLDKFRSQMIETDFQSNIRIYASLLIKAQVAVGKLTDWGVSKWKREFKHINPQKIEEDIDKYFAEEVKNRMIKYQEVFRTKLLSKETQV